MKTRLIWITPNAEQLLAYIARVSSSNQDNPDYAKLIGYLIEHKHWSPFEMVSACFEIETSRAIARQILRHKSFSFQELSLRYVEAQSFENVKPRKQAKKNRQSSTGDLDPDTERWFAEQHSSLVAQANDFYNEAIKRGVARESARFSLPECATSRLYMAGTMRSWIHYLDLRTQEDTQQEHREAAQSIKQELGLYFPTVFEVLGWNNRAE